MGACWFQGCGEASGAQSSVYCDRHWADLINQLKEVTSFIGDGASSVYVGRTNYPERRMLEHLRERNHDRLAVLHWTANRHEMKDVEEALIAHVKKTYPLKGDNRDDESSGGKSGPWYAIYVSWREKAKAREIPVRWRVVTHLDEVPLAPTPGFMEFASFLRAGVRAEQVSEIIEARYGAKTLVGARG